MIAIIPHPTEQLKLNNFQKEICNNISTFPYFPLWFKLPADFFSEDDFPSPENQNILKGNLKEIASKIDYLNIDIFNSEQKGFPELRLNIFSNGKSYISLLPLILEHNPISEADKSIMFKKISSSDLFPMSLKIFRVAKAVKLTENSQGLQAFVWKKLH